MSRSLLMVNEQLKQFQNGSQSLRDMWANIEANIIAFHNRSDEVDPFDDDKTDRRIPIQLIGS